MTCDVGEVTESLENQNELWRRWSDRKLGEWALLIIEIMNKKIRVLNHSESFRKQPVKISAPCSKYFVRKSALRKHCFNIDKIELSGAP